MTEKEKNPLVSVIIPVFNAEKTIERAVRSVENQTYKNWELILVDDCSSDNSRKILKSLENKQIHSIHLNRNSGPANTRNAGIKAAKGDFIAFLDADDFWDAEKLEKQLSFMEKKDCAFSYTSYKFANEDGYSIKTRSMNVPEKLNYRKALKNTIIFTSTVMFDLRKVSKSGVYMIDVKSEDTATWWKILKEVDYAYGLNEPLSSYCRSRDTLSSNKIEAIRRIWNLYRNVEKLNLPYSCYNFCFYALRAVGRRV